uniref:RRM domain-containing protein n=1 Tax=Ditylenchus dipsaci TaxID=166011 RepID=A0A915DQU1_9BILA
MCSLNVNVLTKQIFTAAHPFSILHNRRLVNYISLKKLYTFSVPSSCKVVLERATGEPYYYGAVNFPTIEEREKVLSSSPLTIDGETVHTKVYSKKLPASALCVSGLPENITEEVLINLYSQFGTICAVSVSRNSENKCRGFAFVQFSSLEELYTALCCKPHKLHSNELDVTTKGRISRELTLRISDLQAETRTTDLYRFYAKYDRLDQCIVKRDRMAKKSKKFGYVAFATTQGFDDALNEQPHVINGKQVTLNYASTNFTVRIQNLSANSTCESVQQYFSRFGKVLWCNKDGARVAYVTFDTMQQVETALKASPHIIDDTKVTASTQEKEVAPSFGLVIRAIADRIGEDRLTDYFSKYGAVTSCEIYRQRYSKAMAFLNFDSEEAVNKAIKKKKHGVDGHVLDVQISKLNKV